MGVYIFRSVHGPYIKVGHYSGRNAFSRVAHRGFYSCVCPREIENRVSMEDVELLAWYPGLRKKSESEVKRKWRHHRIYGKSEWFPLEQLGSIQSFLGMQDDNRADQCDPFAAVLERKRL